LENYTKSSNNNRPELTILKEYHKILMAQLSRHKEGKEDKGLW
jgi:hypothetical protein